MPKQLTRFRSIVNRLREILFKRLFRARFRYDVFISYNHRAKAYAVNLKRQLADLDFSCFIDEEEAPPGSALDPTLAKALKKSAVLVLLATERALTRPYIALEFEKFVATGRRIIPINICGGLTANDEAALAQPPWNTIKSRNLIWIDEADDAFAKEVPSPPIADGIDKLFKYTRRNSRVRTEIIGTAALVVLAAIGAGLVIKGKAAEVSKQASLAAVAKKETEKQQVIATEASREAQRQLALAANATKEAKRQGEIAETAKKEAQHQQEIARTATAEADKQQRLATAAKIEADRQQKIAKEQLEHNQHLLYDSGITISQRQYEAGDLDRAQIQLDSLVPKADQNDVRGFEWHYLSSLYHRKPASFEAHKGNVTSAAFSPNGKMFATGSGDTFKLWDSATHQLVATLGGSFEDLETSTAIAFSGDGRVVTNSRGTLKLWDVASNRLIATLEEYRGNAKAGTAVAFSLDGGIIAAGFDQVYKLWDAKSQRPIATIGTESEGGHTNGTTALALSPDGKSAALLVYTLKERTIIEVWDVASKKLVSRALGARVHFAENVFFSSDGKHLIVGDGFGLESFDSTELLMPGTGYDPDKAFKGPDTSARFPEPAGTVAALSPDGSVVATGQRSVLTLGGGVKLWDVNSCKLLATLGGVGLNGEVSGLTFSPDGRTLLIGGKQQVQLNDPSPEPNTESIATGDYIRLIAFSPDGKKAVAVSVNASQVGSLDGVGRTFEIIPALGVANFATFSPDSRFLATTNVNDRHGGATIWDADTHKPVTDFQPVGEDLEASSVAFSPDGKTLALGCNGVIQWWDIATHKQLVGFQPPESALGLYSAYYRMTFSPDGKLLAALAEGPTSNVVVFDAVSHRFVAFVPNQDRLQSKSVAFSPDSKTLAVGRSNATAELWNVVSLQTASRSEQGLSLDKGSGRLLALLAGHSSVVSAVAFSPDGKTLATGSDDRTVKLWSTTSYQLLMTLEVEKAGAVYDGFVRTVAFSPDGRTLMAGGHIPSIRLWRARGK